MSKFPELHPQIVQPFGAGRDYVLIPADEFAALLTVLQNADDALWDSAFAATTDSQWDTLIGQWTAGEATGIAIVNDELTPVALGPGE